MFLTSVTWEKFLVVYFVSTSALRSVAESGILASVPLVGPSAFKALLGIYLL